MANVKIQPTPNGPYKVSGDVELFDTDGKSIETKDGEDIFLCRCGASTKKPFCDGTHSAIGFKAAEAAAKESDES